MIIKTTLVLLILTLLTSKLGIFYTSEKLASYIWIALLIFAITNIFNKWLKYALAITRGVAFGVYRGIVLPFAESRKKLFLLIIVILFTSSLNKNYYLGGDDTRLFYIYPDLYFNNYISRIVPTSSVSAWIGFLTPRTLYYFSAALLVLKKLLPWANLQSLLYTLNLIGGFYFFYRLIDYFSERGLVINNYTKLITSFMYVFSIFNIYILFNSKLIAIYALSIVPLSMYLFLRAVLEKKIHLLAMISIVWSLFAVVSTSMFWYSATFITLIPLFLYFLRNRKLRFVKYSALLAIFLVLLNIHWLVFLPYTSLFRSSLGASQISLTSQYFLETTVKGIRSTASINDLFYPLVNLFHYQIQRNFRWPYLGIFEGWYLKLIPLNAIFILTIVYANVIVRRKKTKALLSLSLLSLLLSIYLFTVDMGNTKLGNWGIELFVFISKVIPGFLAFRSMYDKFAHSVAFNFAIISALSLSAIAKSKITAKKLNILLVVFMIVVVLNAAPFLFGKFDKLPVWRTSNTYHSVKALNNDYLELAEYIKSEDYKGRYLSLPLDRGNIMPIQDKYKDNHFYVGVSPLLVLSGKNDYSGGLSFGPFGGDIMNSLFEKDYENVGKVLQLTNTKYVITNNTITPDLQNSYLYAEGLYDLQNEEFLSRILGEKIRDFGERYSLFKIKNDLENEKIFITDEPNQFPDNFGNLSYKRINDYTYEIEISSWEEGSKLVLLEPYYEQWDLYTRSGEKVPETQEIAFGYANSWDVGVFENQVGSSGEPIKLNIVFTPGKYKNVGLLISLATLASLTVYIILSIRKD